MNKLIIVDTLKNKIFWLILIVITGIFVVASLLLANTLIGKQKTAALSGSDFNAGRIIDDAVFYNSNSMSSDQIQSFLNSKVPNCDTNGSGIATEWGSSLTRAAYAASRGWNAPPYTCLKDFRQDTPQMEAASGLCGSIAAGNRSAANIIFTVAQACNINPQVLTVLLEKEQSLVTDIWPLQKQFLNATGFACPDTAPCNPQYNGFFYQVYYAARQFKVYQAYPNNYNYIAGRTNRIYWHPDLARCGSSNVYIENQATAALYIYTPYRPNAAALNNLNGSGDSCSSYGNRNFWRLFTQWFGSTYEEYSYAFEPMVGTGSYTFPADVSVSTSKVITIGDKMYVLYGDTKSHTLQMLHWNGSSWSRHILDGPAGVSFGATQSAVNPTSIEAFSYGNSLQYFYTDSTTNSLRHGFTMNGQLAIETMDGTPTSYLGKTRSLGSSISGFVYGNDGIQLYYFDTGRNSLVHTWWNGRVWNTEEMDGTPTSYLGKTRSLGSSISGTPFNDGIQLFYYDIGNGELIHTFILAGRWVTEVMDGDTNAVLGNYINAGRKVNVSNVNGQLVVLYYDDASAFSSSGRTSAWRIAYTSKRTGNWMKNILDGGSTSSKSGQAAALPLSGITVGSYRGTVQIFYNDSQNYLKHVWLY